MTGALGPRERTSYLQFANLRQRNRSWTHAPTVPWGMAAAVACAAGQTRPHGVWLGPGVTNAWSMRSTPPPRPPKSAAKFARIRRSFCRFVGLSGILRHLMRRGGGYTLCYAPPPPPAHEGGISQSQVDKPRNPLPVPWSSGSVLCCGVGAPAPFRVLSFSAAPSAKVMRATALELCGFVFVWDTGSVPLAHAHFVGSAQTQTMS